MENYITHVRKECKITCVECQEDIPKSALKSHQRNNCASVLVREMSDDSVEEDDVVAKIMVDRFFYFRKLIEG